MAGMRAIVLFVLLAGAWSASGQTFLGRRLEVLPDSVPEARSVEDLAARSDWAPLDADVPNLGTSNRERWLRLVLDPAVESGLLLEVQNPTLDAVDCHFICDGRVVQGQGLDDFGTYRSFAVPLDACDQLTALIRVKSGAQLLLPMRLAGPRDVDRDADRRNLFFAAYAGIIAVMLLYNLFLYFSVGDRSYLIYSLFVLVIGGTQLVLNGYAPMFGVEPGSWAGARVTHLSGILSGWVTVGFAQVFLQLKDYTPRLNKVLYGYAVLYGVALVLVFAGLLPEAYNLINFCALAVPLLVYASASAFMQGYRPAGFFLLAFGVFIGAVLVFVLKDFGVIPYNAWTFYSLPAGSAIEVVLLSLALASRINQLKRESAEAKEEQLRMSLLNEQLVREKNSELEGRVRERTSELQRTNQELSAAMAELRSTQDQLVQNEKLASIGQLTAGIAHELNNPINFVTSSAHSLRRDIDDLNTVVNGALALDATDAALAGRVTALQRSAEDLDLAYTQREVEELLTGIEDGARRTSEIVRGLRIFSRMDGDAFISADVNELLESTLVILRSNLKDKTTLAVDLAGGLPSISCQPGRLNQVFMNVLTNAAHAVAATDRPLDARQVAVRTRFITDATGRWVEVRIGDNGVGMDEATRSQIFDPFFTTKEVGEGTGLGLSIAMGILKDHRARVEVQSEPGVGTSFILSFPA